MAEHTTTYPRPGSLWREILAVFLIVLGVAGLIYVGFHVPWQVNAVGLSLISIAAGVSLGVTR